MSNASQRVRAFLTRRETSVPLTVFVLTVFLGAPLGLLWESLSGTYTLDQVFAAEESTLAAQFDSDLVYLLFSVLLGLLAGALASFLVRGSRRPDRMVPNISGALMLGGVLAGGIAAKVGELRRVPDGIDPRLLRAPAESRDFVLDLIQFRLRLSEFRIGGASSHFVINAGVLVLPAFAIVGFALALWFSTRSVAPGK